MTDQLHRRDLLKQALATGAGLAAAGALTPLPAIAESISAATAPDAVPERPAGATVRHATIGPNVVIPAGSTVTDSTLRDTILGTGTTVTGCTLHTSMIGNACHVEGVTGAVVLGDHSEVRRSS